MPDPVTSSESTWRIDPDAYGRWLGNKAEWMAGVLNPSEPTLKHLVLLALLEDQDRPWTYADILDAIRERGVIRDGFIDVSGLRVALADLNRLVGAANIHWSIEQVRVGRTAQFRIVGRSVAQPTLAPHGGIAVSLDSPALSARQIATGLVERRRLPFAAHYVLPLAACDWLSMTANMEDKRKYEEAALMQARAWDGFADAPSARSPGCIASRFARTQARTLNLIGMATGEGVGERALIESILESTPKTSRIDYVCVESSPLLLVAHMESLRLSFSDSLSTRLRCVGVLGDVFELSAALELARSVAIRSGMTDFLREDAPAVATYFGNCLGNDDPDREWRIFDSLNSALSRASMLSTILGVSAMPKDPRKYEKYPARVWRFFLQTARYLVLHELDLEAENKDEFLPPTEKEVISDHLLEDGPPKGSPRLRMEVDSNHRASFGLRGQLHRFYYRTQGRLVANQDGGRTSVLPAGKEILLHSITKYDVESLVSFLREHALEVDPPKKLNIGPAEIAVIVTHRPEAAMSRREA